MKQPKPLKVKMSIKDVSRKADSLMSKSYAKKDFASTQERLGKAQIANKVKPGQTGTSKEFKTLGKPYPVGKERVDIANKAKQSAKVDSLKSVSLRKQIKKK